ncbi:MAG: hypothetical protein AAB922_04920 [Patescibacteria group bacterium]
MTKTTLQSSSPVLFTHPQVNDAFLYIQDILERSQIEFIVLDDLAKKLFEYNYMFEVPEISLGVLQRHFTESGSSTLHSMLKKAVFDDSTISCEYNSVPIVIWIIKKKFKFLERPDKRAYLDMDLALPNPFKSYWNARWLVR